MSDIREPGDNSPLNEKPPSVTKTSIAMLPMSLPLRGCDRGVVCAWTGFYAHQNRKPRSPS